MFACEILNPDTQTLWAVSDEAGADVRIARDLGDALDVDRRAAGPQHEIEEGGGESAQDAHEPPWGNLSVSSNQSYMKRE